MEFYVLYPPNDKNMKKPTSLKNTTLIAIAVFCLFSCKSYYIPLESFKKQFEEMDSTELREVITVGPWGGQQKYKTYPIDYISCVDKDGNPAQLENGPSIEMRITDTNGRRTVFYFDLIKVNNSYVYGVESRFMPSITKKIPLGAIKKIEVQDGKKKFRYLYKSDN